MLDIIEGLPEGFLSAMPDELHRVLRGPTLLCLPGEAERPLVVGALLHGNEPAGLHAVQHVLRELGERPLPRSLLVFVGNLDAARARVRRLDGQPDYNRIWAGGDTPETVMAARVLEEVRARSPLAVVDIHNNTGRNPYYALVPKVTPAALQLASRFSPLVVYQPYPSTTFAAATSRFAPAITIECGPPWDAGGYAEAAAFVFRMLEMSHLPDEWPEDMHLHESVACVRVPDDVRFGFDGEADLILRRDLEEANFKLLPSGEQIARVKPGTRARLIAVGEDGSDVTDRFLALEGDRLVTTRSVVPAMFTLDERVIRQDCVGYLLERREARAGV